MSLKKVISGLALFMLSVSLSPTLVAAYSGVNLANVEPVAVYTLNDGSFGGFYYNETTAATDSTVDDVEIFTGADDALYIGFDEKFDGVAIDMSTPISGSSSVDFSGGYDGIYEMQYWDGSTWAEIDQGTDLSIILNYDIKNSSTDDVFTQTWDRPDDWSLKTVSTSSSLYFVRLFITETYSSTEVPYAAQIGIIDYNLKVQVKDEFGDGITGMEEGDFELSAEGSGDDTIYDFAALGDGWYGFALDSSAGDTYSLSVFPSGFVSKDPARTGIAVDWDESLYEIEDMPYSHVLDAENEAGTKVDISEADAGASSVDCIIDGGEAYCPVDIGDDGTGTEAHVYADGYAPYTGALTNRASGSGQVFESYTLEYAYIATVEDENGNPITDATVLAGDDYSVSCDYLSSGDYGCPIGLDSTDPLVRISASGFETLESAFSSERDELTDAQVSSVFTLTEGEDETDTDGDGLSDSDEATYGTDPADEDSDDDGIRDGSEVAHDTDPNDANDYLADGEDYYVDCTSTFTDIEGNFAEKAICILQDEGVVDGRDSEHYAPSSEITRAEFLKIALLNAGYTVTANDAYSFPDLDEDAWYYSYVTFASEQGIVEGYPDGLFRPNDPINRAEAVAIVMRMTGMSCYDVVESDLEFPDFSADDWFACYVVSATEGGILQGYSDGEFKPANHMTRAEMAVVARRAWYVYYE